ncbi:MAG: ferritin-like domain-containing protein [bacterium]|nr:ferritin-like domain-containing protein [bacterium]MCP5066078.1 ferritin-like domain-containing protein [bacterium]
MNYTQHNPVPIPAMGEHQSIQATIDTVFDWKYALDRKNLNALYEKGKAAQWNASDLDWSTEVNVEKMMQERAAGGMGAMMEKLLNPPKKLTDAELMEMQLNMNAFMLSQFLHGEQGAMMATAKIVLTAPDEDAKFYASNQVMDEARHVEVYHRYLTEKLAITYEVNKPLADLLEAIITAPQWDLTCLGMQVMVEGVALAAFGMMQMMMAGEPLIQSITSNVIADEARHVAFGVLSLEGLYNNEMSANELREREDFVLEATFLLRERLLMEQVFERMGWDGPVWVEWAKETPFMRGFRQMTFAKVVPNLKRLGLLTPRVRDAFEKMDILQYENLTDSVEQPAAPPPQDLVKLLLEFLGNSTAPEGPPVIPGVNAPMAS